MTLGQIFITGVGVMALTAGPLAQTTSKTTEATGAPSVTKSQMSGEVVLVDQNNVLVRMQPSGQYRIFTVAPTRQFMIDGQPKTVNQLTPGTVLTATITTTAQPVTDRTTTVTNGTVWFVDKNTNHLIVTLPNGENRWYNVPAGYMFTVEGKPATIEELRKGMKVSGTKIASEPRTEITNDTVVTGKASK